MQHKTPKLLCSIYLGLDLSEILILKVSYSPIIESPQCAWYYFKQIHYLLIDL